jgi:hypothetical protein
MWLASAATLQAAAQHAERTRHGTYCYTVRYTVCRKSAKNTNSCLLHMLVITFQQRNQGA